MQEIGQLVLGIDISNDITQITVMRPYSAEPEGVCFDVQTRKEYIPTAMYEGVDGMWEIGEAGTERKRVISDFFHRAVRGGNVTFAEEEYSGEILLEQFFSALFQKIRSRFPEHDIGFLALTCEEANTDERVKHRISDILEKQDCFCGRHMVLSHLEAFLHFAIRQEEELWKDGSAAFDYATDGLLFYHMECRIAGGRRLVLAEYRDYSDVISAGFTKQDETEKVALTFEHLAGNALRKQAAALYVTGREFEGEWVSDVLRLLSSGRRVFRGENLFTQGACYTAMEAFRRENNADFQILMPDQITSDIYLQAENADRDGEILLVRAGEHYKTAVACTEVILDTVDRLTFRVAPAGLGTSFTIRIVPKELALRPDRTSRYSIRLFFVKRDCIAIQIKDVGFGAFYPSTHRIYEELVDLSQLES